MEELHAQGEDGWIGRSGPGADFFDLYVMRPEGDLADEPPAAALARLRDAIARIDELKAQAASTICAARQARLGWRAGPLAPAWEIVEARIDAGGDLWLSLHEYETDEYSLWLVRTEGPSESWLVRRRPWVPYEGPPGEAGDLV